MTARQPLTDYMKSILNKRERQDRILELKKLPNVTVIDGTSLDTDIEKAKSIINAVISAMGDKPLSDEDFQTLLKNINKKKDK